MKFLIGLLCFLAAIGSLTAPPVAPKVNKKKAADKDDDDSSDDTVQSSPCPPVRSYRSLSS